MPEPIQVLRVFLSSPGDVAHERRTARTVLERLRAEFADRLRIEPFFWEYEPLEFAKSFQANIPNTAEFDIVLCFLWSRLGSALHRSLLLPDGSPARSGTEYEVLHALDGQKKRGTPELHIWRNETDVVFPANPPDVRNERITQWEALQEFWRARTRDAADGTFIASYSAYKTLGEFEELFETKLRKILARRLSDQPAASTPHVRRTWTDASPYRGLEAFDLIHAPIFFGRTRSVGDGIQALRQSLADPRDPRGFLLVLGASGSGKSSLARAGLVPALLEPNVLEGVGHWRRATLRPSDSPGNPCLALANALLHDTALPELRPHVMAKALAERLASRPDEVIGELRGCLRQIAGERRLTEQAELQSRIAKMTAEGRSADAEALQLMRDSLTMPQVRLLLLVDQCEELFTTATAPELRTQFAIVLAALARSGQVVVLVTLRSDFASRLEALPELLEVGKGTGTLHLGPPNDHELAQMIRFPAQAAGAAFEDHAERGRLDERIRAEAGTAASLPLLQYALDELYRTGHADGLLTHAEYEQIGGLQGAIAGRAEAAFLSLPIAGQQAFDVVLRLLVTLGEGDELVPTRKVLRPRATPLSPAACELVQALVAARLLTADQDGDGEHTVALAHEELLTSWPRIHNWIASNHAFLRQRAHLERRFADYESHGCQKDLLLRGLPLAEAEDLQRRDADALPAEQRAFIVASQRHRAARKQALRIAVVVVLLVLASSLLVALLLYHEEARQRLQAQREAIVGTVINVLCQQTMLALGAEENWKSMEQRASQLLETIVRGDLSTPGEELSVTCRRQRVYLAAQPGEEDRLVTVPLELGVAPPMAITKATNDAEPFTAVFALALGHKFRGHSSESLAYYDAAITVARAKLRPGHWILGPLLTGSCSELLQVGRLDEAENRLLEAYSITRSYFGPRGQLAINAAAGLVRVYSAKQQDDLAALWTKRARGDE